MGDRIFIKIQKNDATGPTMLLVSPESHPEAGTGYRLHFSGMEFTADPTTGWLTVQGENVLKKGSCVWVANRGDTLPNGLVPRTDYYVCEVNSQKVKLAENRHLTALATFTDAGAGTHFFLTWPDAPPFHKLQNQLYKPNTIQEAGALLAEALTFHPAIQAALNSYVQSEQEEPVPIYIEIGPEDADALPWEALHRDSAGDSGFLGLDLRWPIARVIPRNSVERNYALPVKIMAILSAPTPDEGAAEEWDAIYRALMGSGLKYDLLAFFSEAKLLEKIQKNGIPNTTVLELLDEDQILKALADYQPNLLHFYCHGSSEGPAKLIIHSALDIEIKLDPSINIETSKLWSSANRANLPWLLTLNCCESAAPASSDTLNIASNLAKRGFPSVVGMRRRVTSDYANHFTRFFYHDIFRLLAAASDEDNAEIKWSGILWRARQEIASKFAYPSQTYSEVAPFCNEWTVPVLYTSYEPLKLKKLNNVDERVKAKRQTLEQIHAGFQTRGDPDSRKLADELEKKIVELD